MTRCSKHWTCVCRITKTAIVTHPLSGELALKLKWKKSQIKMCEMFRTFQVKEGLTAIREHPVAYARTRLGSICAPLITQSSRSKWKSRGVKTRRRAEEAGSESPAPRRCARQQKKQTKRKHFRATPTHLTISHLDDRQLSAKLLHPRAMDNLASSSSCEPALKTGFEKKWVYFWYLQESFTAEILIFKLKIICFHLYICAHFEYTFFRYLYQQTLSKTCSQLF